MTNIEALAKAISLDNKILKVKNKIKTLPERSAFKETQDLYNDIDRKYNEVLKEKQSTESKIKKLEQEIELTNKKIDKEEKKLFSGSITNPKELNAIQREIESFRGKVDGLETQEIEVMQELDEINKTFDLISEKHSVLKSDKENKEQAYKEALAKLESELESLKHEIMDAKSLIEPVLLFKYESLSEEKGVGGAFLVDETCTGCHIVLPKDEAAKFIAKKDIGKCPNCKRLLLPPEYAKQ